MKIKKMIFLACGFALLMSCSKEKKITWIEIGTTDEVRFSMASVIETGSDKTKPFIGVKTLWDYSQPKLRETGKSVKSSVLMMLIDCSKRTAASMSYVEYADTNATGSIVASGERDIKEAEQQLVEITHPAMQAIATRACSFAKP